jgi:hypothetical protein
LDFLLDYTNHKLEINPIGKIHFCTHYANLKWTSRNHRRKNVRVHNNNKKLPSVLHNRA